MKTSDINMTVHAVFNSMPIQKGPEFKDIIGKMFWWNCGIFDKGNRFSFTRHVAKKAHPFFAKIPKFRDFTCFPGNEVAKCFSGKVTFFQNFLANRVYFFFQFTKFFAREFNEIDGFSRFPVWVFNPFFYPGIDFIRFSEGQDFFIEGFDRGWV